MLLIDAVINVKLPQQIHERWRHVRGHCLDALNGKFFERFLSESDAMNFVANAGAFRAPARVTSSRFSLSLLNLDLSVKLIRRFCHWFHILDTQQILFEYGGIERWFTYSLA